VDDHSAAAPAERRAALLAAGAALITVVFWASAFVAIRHVGHQFGPGPVALGRLLVGSAVLGVALVISKLRSTPKAAPTLRRREIVARLVTMGVLWMAVYNVALNAAERRVDAGTASMLVNVGPILIAVLAAVVLHEGFPRRLAAGIAISFAGVAVIAFASESGGHTDLWGVAGCLVAAVVYSVAVIVQKPLLGSLSGLAVTWAACTIGAVVCLPFGPQLIDQTRTADPATVWWIVYLGAFPTALGFTTWAYALARTSAGRLGASTYVVPPIAVLLGWALLGEAPAVLAYAGGVLCLLGVYVARRQPRRRVAVTEPDAPVAEVPATAPS
jgi:drug/metabolite transporter (DMT)-like permease